MTEWLLDLFDLRDQVPAGARVHFEWGYLPQGDTGLVLVAALAGLLALTAWLYKREGQAGVLRKAALASLRTLVYAGVLLVLLEPRLAVDTERTVEGATVVLWDTSLSMSLREGYRDAALRDALAQAAGLADPRDVSALSRSELAWRVVSRAGLLPGLAQRNRLLLLTFDREARRAESVPAEPGGPLPESLQPRGPVTDLAQAVRKALEETGGVNLAAVVAISDGQLNKGEGEQGVIDLLAGRRIPFYAVGVGDPSPPLNLEVVDVRADARVTLGDPLVIEGTVRALGYAGQAVDVELTVQPREGGEPRLLERRTVTFPADGEAVPLSFRHAPEAKGVFVFGLRIAPREEEPVTDDNERGVTVTVSDDHTRVLLVSGGPSFEYHFLKQRLLREKAIDLSCWLQSADPRFPQEGGHRIEALPLSDQELEEYDVVLLLDPNPRDFDAGAAEAYKRFVATRRGGLLYVPGPSYGSAFLGAPELRPFRDLLPVVPGEAAGGEQTSTERWPCRVTAIGSEHPAARLDPDPERCRALWSGLPGFFSSWPVLREKAGATILARHEDPAGVSDQGGRPVLVTHFFEGGPVLFLGAGETWRWRSVAQRVYDRFWVGVLRFLVQGRVAGGRKRVELLTDREDYPLGEPVRVRVQAFDRGFRPLETDRLLAQVRAAGEDQELALLPPPGGGQPGWYEGSFLPSAQGPVELSVRLPDDDPGTRPESVTINVRLPEVEFAEPRQDVELLTGIAQATSGALVAPAEVAALPERIPSLREQLLVAGTPLALWDRWSTIVTLCLLLAVEWAWRKRSRMA